MLALFGMFGVLSSSYAEISENKTSLKEIKKETQDLIKALKSYSVEQQDAAVRKTKATLDNLDRRIEALEARIHKNWDTMDQATRKKARDTLKALRKQRTQVAEWYESLKNSSADGWNHMKQGFSNAYQALQKAWEKAEEEFKPGNQPKSD